MNSSFTVNAEHSGRARRGLGHVVADVGLHSLDVFDKNEFDGTGFETLGSCSLAAYPL
ncbi:hypothetical protein [Marinagarivorans cellulosilyticus]|uniref:hypothetical protein n=1 Tax=Marinagarivorans cellulosilyticus TaxID=2721545 RepID=UPI001F21E649|nr:hypothetical protein [Marinagarivorans cellulosilyticus]